MGTYFPYTYTREIPAEWPQLVETARLAVAPNTPLEQEYTWEQAHAVHDVITALPTERLEHQYYYALGNVICNVALHLHQPPARLWAVGVAARQLAATATARRPWRTAPDIPFVPTICDIRPSYMDAPFKSMAENAWTRLPAHKRLLVDAVTVAAKARRMAIEYGKPEDPDSAIKQLLEGGAAADVVGEESLDATTQLIRVALIAKLPRPTDRSTAHRTPVTFDVLRSLELAEIANSLAQLRDDEYREMAGIDTDSDGNLVFDARVLLHGPPPPPESTSGMYHHDGRFVCPAVGAADIIPLMLRVVPEIVHASQHPDTVFLR